MKLLFFDDFKLGVLNGTDVVDVMDVVKDVPRIHPQDLIAGVIERWDEYKPLLEAASKGAGVPVSSVRIRPPLPRPANIACMAVNFLEGRDAPVPINAFNKSPGAIIGNNDTMVLPDMPAQIFEGEAEMAIVIGKRARNVPASEAMSYIFGYTNFIDGSARGLAPQFYQVKSRETFAPIGPFIVTADEIPDPQHVQIKLWNNGTLMQDYNTDDMGHKIPRCIEFISAQHTLEAGDILALGTNHGGLNPFMDGDKIEIEGEGLGRLTVTVKDDLKRTWKRETRGERAKAGLEGFTPQVGGKYAPQA